jgi:hypothetical protein
MTIENVYEFSSSGNTAIALIEYAPIISIVEITQRRGRKC